MNLRFWTRTFWSDIGYGLGSSPWLVRRLVSLADIGEARVIVELGAGDGCVTRAIIAAMHPDARLITIEMDESKAEILRTKFSTQCEVYAMSAAHIDQIVGHDAVDVIISTLPLGSISLE
jgi:phospholipid N-methyltransferase